MNFHFCLSTLPIQFHESVQDTILLIAAGLLDCSCNVTIDNEQAIFGGTTINLFLEHFDYETATSLVATKRQKGSDFPLGLIFTENLNDANVMAGEFTSRSDNFKRVAEIADFIWYFIPGTADHTVIVDPKICHQFKVGYSERYAVVPVQATRDIDFLLPGLTYPRRKPILETLHGLGYHVRSTDLTTPAYIYQSLIGRSKTIIDIGRYENTTNMSTIRICNGAANGITVIAEKFDTSELSELYDYAVITDYEHFIDNCIEVIEKLDPIKIGLEFKEKFACERPLKYYVEALLLAPQLDNFRKV